ncbi:MAG: LytTR family DNA-binding domain-containing protein [Bacteroidota bacterium]
MQYRVLIVDDEEPARNLLAAYVQKIEELSVVAILDNALAAKARINQGEVDILLSDIQMDDLTGIDLVRMIKSPVATIFTTAYSEYALEGYDLDVIDYLVKPISFQRFCRSIDKAVEWLQFNRRAGGLGQGKASREPGEVVNVTSYLFVKTNRKLVKVNYADILFVQSYGEYVKLYTNDDVILALQTTNFMEQQLPATDFVRIHRSHIVNVNHIKEIIGNQVVIEKNTLTVSKRMKEPFMAVIRAKGLI